MGECPEKHGNVLRKEMVLNDWDSLLIMVVAKPPLDETGMKFPNMPSSMTIILLPYCDESLGKEIAKKNNTSNITDNDDDDDDERRRR